MPSYYEGVRPASDAGPNQFTGAPAGQHWKAVGQRSASDLTVDTAWLTANATGKVERFSCEAKPESVDEVTNLKLFVIQDTEGGSFNPASGFMEFGLKVYKADGVTLLGSATAHIPNNYVPIIADPDPAGPYWNVQEYDLGAVSLNQADVDAGVIIELDSTAADGWGGGGSWRVYACWLGYTYTVSAAFESIVEGTSRLESVCEGWSPIATCAGDSPIPETVEGYSSFEEQT